jgi:6-phosphogluconolactonase
VTDPNTSVMVYPDADTLASAVADRLATGIIDAQAAHGSASVVLTGGRIAEKIYTVLRDSVLAASVDWSSVDLWWGDERFLPSGDPDRNETQARAVLLDALPLSPDRVHPMGASDGPDGDDPEAAAGRYARELAEDGPPVPRFDIVLLGIGEDGHVASVFPDHPSGDAMGTAAAVHDSPKPPPIRITLTLSTLNTADEVWVIASGAGKADAVELARSGTTVPAGRVHGRQATWWLLDQDAASKL